MDKISPIKKRILQYIEYAGITKQFFCKKTGISYANIRGKSLESEFGGTQIAEILSIFEEISSDWLLTGKGEMLRNINTAASVITENHAMVSPNACLLCDEKERVIAIKDDVINAHLKTIRSQEVAIESLKEMISVLKNEDDLDAEDARCVDVGW